MKILVTNDDGVNAEGLWTLVKELMGLGEVVVVAPDREVAARSGSISLYRPIRARKVLPHIPGVETFAVEGTPADSVILALGKLAGDGIDLVISGINRGSNLGDDVVISGTVGAALQAHLLGKPSFAMSITFSDANPPYFEDAARFAALLAGKFNSGGRYDGICLNVNFPDLPRAKVKGVSLTYPASKSHTDTVEERFSDGRHQYWVIRKRKNQPSSEYTDIGAVERGNIAISPLLTNRDSKIAAAISEELCAELFRELQRSV
jgi:5'-nucleotidase